MKTTKWIDFLLYSNIFISTCAAAITAETYLLIHSEINWIYILFVFFSTLVLYDFPGLFFGPHPDLPPKGEGVDSAHQRWIAKNRSIHIVLSVISVIALAITVFFFPLKFILWMIPNAVLAFAYFFPQTRLRSITGLKAAVVAIVWVTTTAFYPLMLASFSNGSGMSQFDSAHCDILITHIFSKENYLLLTERFLFLLPLCVIFNVRDIEADRIAGVRTIPVVYGLRPTIITCVVSLLLFSALVFFNRGFSPEAIALTASAIITGMLILKSSPDKDDYFYSFGVDGMILLQAMLVIALHG